MPATARNNSNVANRARLLNWLTFEPIIHPMHLDPAIHPAVRLGAWLKTMRQKHGFVKRIFAERIYLRPAKYTEVEAGVVSWIEKKNEDAIVTTLELTQDIVIEFNALLKEARDAAHILFSQLFSREQLTPIRSRLSTNRTINEIEKKIILDAVFAPLT